MSVKGRPRRRKRAYVSPLRTQQARETSGKIVDAAQRLFIERGYLATSISEIARAAGTAERTVYAAFGSKRALLFAAVDASITGDSGPEAVADRGWFQSVIDESDPQRKIELFVAAVRGIHERTASMFRVVQQSAAADSAVAETLAAHRHGQTTDERKVVDSLARLGKLRPGLSREMALETLWALTTPDFYAQVADRGWPPERYERWLCDALTRLLIASSDPSPL